MSYLLLDPYSLAQCLEPSKWQQILLGESVNKCSRTHEVSINAGVLGGDPLYPLRLFICLFIRRGKWDSSDMFWEQCLSASLPTACHCGHAAQSMGLLTGSGPHSRLLCAGWAPQPLAWVSAQCWSLDENLSCSTQHNVTIIAPIQRNDTWLLVHPGPQKADKDLSGDYWGRRVSWLDENLSFCCTSWFLFQGTRLLPAPRPQVRCQLSQSPEHCCVCRKRSVCSCAPVLHIPTPWILQEKSTLGSLSKAHRLKYPQDQSGELCVWADHLEN